MPFYTLFPESSLTGPNTANAVPPTADHRLRVDTNNGDTGYLEFGNGEEEWFAVDATGIPSTDTVDSVALRTTAKDPDSSGDILEYGVRQGGVTTWVDSKIYDALGYVEETFSQSPVPLLSQLLGSEIGVRCTAQSGDEVRLTYFALEVETTAHDANGPIIAGDEDATTM